MSGGDCTVERPLRVEIPKIKGSRFIADLTPAASAAEADATVARIRAEFPDARHHCFAWRTGKGGDTFRFSDDGEPGGTAGRPILQHLEGQAVTNAVLTVVRYFGGTKLGVGGLIRAYGAAAAAALDAATLVPVVIRRRIIVRFRYEESAAFNAFLSARGTDPVESDYGEEISHGFEVATDEVESFVFELRERCAGRVHIEVQPLAG